MRDKVPGMIVPEYYIAEMGAAPSLVSPRRTRPHGRSVEAAWNRAVHRADPRDSRNPGVAGVHIMTVEWEAALRPVVEGAGLLPRPSASEDADDGDKPQPIPPARREPWLALSSAETGLRTYPLCYQLRPMQQRCPVRTR